MIKLFQQNHNLVLYNSQNAVLAKDDGIATLFGKHKNDTKH